MRHSPTHRLVSLAAWHVLFALAIWMMTTEAFPTGAERTKCHLAKYKSLPPRELEAFKKAKDKFVSVKNTHWAIRALVILVKEELHLVIDVLENIRDPNLSEPLGRPLEILRHIREDLKNCVSIGLQIQPFSVTNVFTPSLLSQETPGCLEASVVLNLFRLLNEDLKCAAYMESCT
uniref:Uncharacterized protein n=1 Tax=Chelonoidis abingdonii TaxID=106734 RepID=A0A8C0J8C6_CHEAB